MKNTAYNKLDTALRQGIKLGLVTLPLILTATANAATNNEDVALIDSVHQWGAWGLDIEPAAGGIAPPATQALHARNSKISLRTNSISALSPSITGAAIPATPAIPALPATPTTNPAVPAVPAMPAITPISPSVPIPVGGPSDGF